MRTKNIKKKERHTIALNNNSKTVGPFFCFQASPPLWMEVADCLWALEEEVGWVPLLPPSQRGSDPAERRVWSLHLDLAAFCIAEREIGTIQLTHLLTPQI